MIFEVVPADELMVRHVIWTARAWNRHELRTSLGPLWREKAVGIITHFPQYSYIVKGDGAPICVFGMMEIAKGHFQLYMFGTEAIETCGRPLARILKRTFSQWVKAVKPMSAISEVLDGNPKSVRWFDFLDANKDSRVGRYTIYRFKVR